MSASPVDPPEMEPEESAGDAMPDPTEVAYHLDRFNAKKTSTPDRMISRAWLIEHGVIPDPKGKPKAPRKKAREVSQGKPPEDAIYSFESGRARRLALGEPRNLEAEVSLIGSIFERPQVLNDLIEYLNPEEFSGDAHRIAVAALIARHRKGLSIDLVTIRDELSRDVVFVELGGKEFLAHLEGLKPSKADPRELVQIVHSYAVRRRVVNAATDLKRKAIEVEDGDELLIQCRALIESFTKDPGTQGWERPLLNEEDNPLPFPLEVLPEAFRNFVESASRICFFPPDFLAVAGLTIAGVGIGRTVALKLKESWIEHASLFSMLVGRPGSGKSTALLKLAAVPVHRLARRLRAEHRDERAAFEQACLKASAKRETVQDLAPKARRIDVDDITREKLVAIMADNPRGPIAIHDEMSDWLNGMNQYKRNGGNDQNIFLKIYSGSPITADRVGQGDGSPLFVPHPFLCIAGGIQPDILPSLSCGQRKDDGFIDRFLFAFPAQVARSWSWESIDKPLIEGWCSAFERLWDRWPDFNGEDDPILTRFSAKAHQRYGDWVAADCEQLGKDQYQKDYEGTWVKYQTSVVRIALILEQLHWAYDPNSRDRVSPVGLAALEGALALIDYFKSHFRRVHFKIHGGRAAENELATDILNWCEKEQLARFRESEVREHFRKRLARNPHELATSLTWLVSRRCLRKSSAPTRSVGRPQSPLYEVNPYLFPGNLPKNPINSEVVAAE